MKGWVRGVSRSRRGWWGLVWSVALSGAVIDGAALGLGVVGLRLPDWVAVLLIFLQVALWSLPAFVLASSLGPSRSIGASMMATMLQVLLLLELAVVGGLLAGHPEDAVQGLLLFLWLGLAGGIAAAAAGLVAGVAMGGLGWLAARILLRDWSGGAGAAVGS